MDCPANMKIHFDSQFVCGLRYQRGMLARYAWPVAYVLSICMLLGFFLYIINIWLDIHIWRPDSIYYLPDYWDKFCEEGRWLNFILFSFLKCISPHLSIIMGYAVIIYFFQTCAQPFVGWKNAILFALAGTQIPSICDLLTWPAMPVPCFLTLATICYLKNRLDWRIIFILGGVIFNGTMNNFYNLLPLLYLYEIYSGKISFFRLLCWYVACFVIGFGISQAIVYVASGSPIHIEEWRRPNPIHNLHDLSSNIDKAFHFFWAQLFLIGKTSLFIVTGMMVSAVIFASVANKNESCAISITKSYFTAFISMAACYAQTVPMGIVVNVRTPHSLFAGLVLLPLLTFSRWRFISLATLLVITTSMFQINTKSLTFYGTITSTFYDNLMTIDADPRIYKLLFISSWKEMKQTEKKLMEINRIEKPTTADGWPVIEELDVPMRWVPAAREAGFKTIEYDFHENSGTVARILKELPSGDFRHNQFYRWRISGEWLVIGIDWPKKHSEQ